MDSQFINPMIYGKNSNNYIPMGGVLTTIESFDFSNAQRVTKDTDTNVYWMLAGAAVIVGAYYFFNKK